MEQRRLVDSGQSEIPSSDDGVGGYGTPVRYFTWQCGVRDARDGAPGQGVRAGAGRRRSPAASGGWQLPPLEPAVRTSGSLLLTGSAVRKRLRIQT